MLNQVVDVEGLLDSKILWIIALIVYVLRANKSVTHCSREVWISFARKDMKGNTR